MAALPLQGLGIGLHAQCPARQTLETWQQKILLVTRQSTDKYLAGATQLPGRLAHRSLHTSFCFMPPARGAPGTGAGRGCRVRVWRGTWFSWAATPSVRPGGEGIGSR